MGAPVVYWTLWGAFPTLGGGVLPPDPPGGSPRFLQTCCLGWGVGSCAGGPGGWVRRATDASGGYESCGDGGGRVGGQETVVHLPLGRGIEGCASDMRQAIVAPTGGRCLVPDAY